MRRVWTIGLALVLFFSGAARAQDEPAEVQAIRAQLPEIMRELEALRGKRFTGEVKVAHQTEAEFRAWVRAELDRQYPEAKARADALLLAAVGLLPEGYDLRQGLIDAFASQAMAHYDIAKGTFFVLKTTGDPEMTRVTVLHELHHALQDQALGLKERIARFETPDFDREDEYTALRFLMEGEATWLMMRYALERAGQGPLLGRQLEMTGTATRRELSRMERYSARASGDTTTLAALEQRDRLPGYLYHMLIDPYHRGAWFIHRVHERGGLEALDGLYARLPESSEQTLHPEKALGEGYDAPTWLELPDLSEAVGKPLVAKNTLGELNLRVLFEALSGDERPAAAAGWDGDRIHAYAAAGDRQAAFVWVLVFDGDADAEEFADALRRVQAKGPAPLREAGVYVAGPDVLVLGGVPAERRDQVLQAVSAGLERR